ncbi:MAG: molecular chaperone HtpG [Burkholderiales bacterium]|nr:molecular chaperone HtpG [Burkholderiales bacterium]
MSAVKEQLSFQAEVKQLLSLMIHSLYSNKEIFLRELISNASDAADKLRYAAIADSSLYEQDPELRIHISVDNANRTVTVADNGIGMSREEVIANIGTIAKSGTQQFFQQLTGDEKKDAHLIGQFGVGFYSAFIVADRVTLLTRRAGLPAGEAVRWESEGAGDYTIETVEKASRGTEVILHLREGEDELLNGWRLKAIIRKYSDHIQIPILMKKETWDKDKGEQVVTDEDETVNQANALWARPKGEISKAQYEEFYKHVGHDFEPPLAWTHSKVEGKLEYTQLLYLPARAPFDLMDRERRHGLKLYVRRVFIMEDAGELLPNYLRFVRGVVDSNDLPLNVSREILQESKVVDTIRGGCVKKVLSSLEELAGKEKDENDPDNGKYAIFWQEFGTVLKEGIAEDHANQERIAKLLRFVSTHSESEAETVSFADYVARMKEGQEKIYYVTADSLAAARNSPHLEIFRKKGIEVLLLTNRIDEWWLAHLTSFDGKPLQSVTKGSLDLGKLEDEKEKAEQQSAAESHRGLTDKIKAALGERVKDVRITHRLTDSPACLVVESNDMSFNLERLLKAAGQKVPTTKPILEINPAHPLVEKLNADENSSRFEDLSHVLFDQALLAEGGQLEDPAIFVRRLNQLMLGFASQGQAQAAKQPD